MNYLSEKDDWGKFDESNQTITRDILYLKNEKICPAYVSKHNSNHEKQIHFLLIPNKEEWHYLAVKNNYVITTR